MHLTRTRVSIRCPFSPAVPSAACRPAVEFLESRTLLSATVATAINPGGVASATGGGGNVAAAPLIIVVPTLQVTVGKGHARLVRFTDPDGTASQLVLGGLGAATVTLTGNGLSQSTTRSGIATVTGTPLSVSISTTGTTAASSINITGRGGNGAVNIAGITTDAALANINGLNAALSGNLTAAAAVTNTKLASASGGTITIGAGGPVNLKIVSASSENLTSAAPIRLLAAGSWAGGGTISAPSIARLAATDFFSSDLNTSSLGVFTAGSITGGHWSVSDNAAKVTTAAATSWSPTFGTLGRLNVRGTIDSSTIRASGNILSIDALSLTNTNVYSGVGPLRRGARLPSVTTDFIAADTITSLRVAQSFVNSDVAAENLGNLSLGVVQLANGGTPFGLAAHQIANLIASAGGRKLRLHDVISAAQVTSALSAQGITPQDFVIRII